MHLLRSPGGLLVLGGLLLGLAACDGSTVAGPDGGEDSAPVSMAFSDGTASTSATSSGTASTRKAVSGQRTLIDPDGNQLRLDRVEMVVREIELNRADGDENCAPEDRLGADEDECAEVKSGPVLVSLPLDGDAPAVVVDTTLPTGRWEEVEFDVHKPEPESSTPDVLEGTDFPAEASIRVQGRYTPADGSARDFTYTSDLNAEREIEFEPPLEVTADNTNNVTFSVHVDAWFRRADSTLVNPTQVTDGGSFEELVEENIESSIEGFEDDDRDGRDDEEEENEEDEEEDENEIEIETALENVGPDSDAAGEVEFEKDANETKFKIEVEDLTTGTYDVVMADTTRGELDVTGDEGEAEVEFRRPSEEGHPPLNFDPRGRRVEVQQGGTPYLETVVPTDENEDGEDNEVEIEVDLNNTGPDSDAAGEVEFEKEADKAAFTVEVGDLTTGTYDVVMADTTRGELDVRGDDGEAEIEFRRPSEEGHPPLDFNPRGQRVAVQRNGTPYLEETMPTTGDQDE
ncbi:hypothetical protein [Salinibacter altiplanensis]|uniref:hypothetical protein n=1 Tax=Salinibacter altiplanensis TaxID=1803181 RepID=UPI001F468A94|nr:hypothetical protein [Salinibacter altiplanensis]